MESCREGLLCAGALYSGKEQLQDFIRMWAIKESYVKRIGIGIGYPFWKVDTTSVKGVMSAEFLDFMVAVSVG